MSSVPTPPALQTFQELLRELGAKPVTANYARISDDPRDRRKGVDGQLEDGREVAALWRLTIGDDYVDNDRSAYQHNEKRQDYQRLCADIAAGRIRCIVVWTIDRLHRDTAVGEAFVRLCKKHRVIIVPHNGVPLDLTNPDYERQFRMGVVEAQYESQRMSMRIRRANEKRARAGAMTKGGMRPFGYEADRCTVRESEATVIREAVRRILAGDTVIGLCRDFERRSVKTVTGAPWRSHTLHRVLTSARISGERSHNGVIVADGTWPGIISKPDGAKLRAVLAERCRHAVRPRRRYLLSGGLLRCGACDQALVARPNQDGRRKYVCALPPNFAGCGKRAVLADWVEDYVVEAVLLRLDSPGLWQALRRPEADDTQPALVQQIAHKREKIAEVDDDFRHDRILREQWLRTTAGLRADIDDLTRQLSKQHRLVVLHDIEGPTMLRARFHSFDLDRKRALLGVLVDHISLGAANKGRNTFDSSRVHITWRV